MLSLKLISDHWNPPTKKILYLHSNSKGKFILPLSLNKNAYIEGFICVSDWILGKPPKKYIWHHGSNIEGFDGSGALPDKMLLVRPYTDKKIIKVMLILGPFRLSKGYLSPSGLGREL